MTRRRPRVRHDRHGVACADFANGLRVRAVIDESVPMAAGWLVWPGGGRLERAQDLGASALIEDLITRGCADIDGDALAQEIEGMAAVLDGFSGRCSMGLHFESLAGDFHSVLARALQCASNPTFDDNEFENARRLAVEALAAEGDDPASVGYQAAMAALYGNHPSGRRRGGTLESLERLTSARLRRIWDTAYPWGRATLAICGAVDLEAVLESVLATHAGDGEHPPSIAWPGRPPRFPRRPIEKQVKGAKEQVHLVLAFPGLSMSDPREWAMEVLNTVVGGQSGRLFAALRERQGLVYHVSASSAEGIDGGHASVYAATRPACLSEARAAILAELDDVGRHPLSTEEIERAKAWLLGQYAVGLQRRSRVASLIGFSEAYGFDPSHHTQYPDRIAAVTADELTALARKIFDPRRSVTALVTR